MTRRELLVLAGVTFLLWLAITLIVSWALEGLL